MSRFLFGGGVVPSAGDAAGLAGAGAGAAATGSSFFSSWAPANGAGTNESHTRLDRMNRAHAHARPRGEPLKFGKVRIAKISLNGFWLGPHASAINDQRKSEGTLLEANNP